MVVTLFIFFAIIGKVLAAKLMGEGIWALMFSILIYIMIILSIILSFPQIIAMKRDEILQHTKTLFQSFKL